MINSKQRAYLKSLAHDMKPLVQVGKEGISQSFIEGIKEILETHELVKVSVLESSGMTADESVSAVCEKTGADFVQSIGRRFVVYKRSKTDPVIEFPTDFSKEKAKPGSTGKKRSNYDKYDKKEEETPISKRNKLEAKKETRKPLAKKPKIRSIAKQKARKSK